MRHAWVSRVGIITLVGGFCLVGYGLGGPPAAAVPPVIEDALAGVTQNWDKNLPSASRFTVLAAFGGHAVRDNNTGLVWEKAPDTTVRSWGDSTFYCINKNVGGTRGWRLPSVAELVSLIDPSLPAPFVPVSVFTGVQLDVYWSATTSADFPADAWYMDFSNSNGGVHGNLKPDLSLAWCVRGGMNADAY